MRINLALAVLHGLSRTLNAPSIHQLVIEFINDTTCKVMLVSLNAGNSGLNLVAASQVIILDPFFRNSLECNVDHSFVWDTWSFKIIIYHQKMNGLIRRLLKHYSLSDLPAPTMHM